MVGYTSCYILVCLLICWFCKLLKPTFLPIYIIDVYFIFVKLTFLSLLVFIIYGQLKYAAKVLGIFQNLFSFSRGEHILHFTLEDGTQLRVNYFHHGQPAG